MQNIRSKVRNKEPLGNWYKLVWRQRTRNRLKKQHTQTAHKLTHSDTKVQFTALTLVRIESAGKKKQFKLYKSAVQV